ncbi:ATP-binding protein [Pyrinomonas methylaliphatogenes]|uniref:Predicted ATPase n=1 Tax=Pyrinomonas methylaliphatogenes TaxID=454194 RepID=A0A0B6X104_9BACT|nr:ATP-binding protein [Pyrinomonas methylaliphatogenes]MBX5478897.1 ATP-binding protein [Pyrinomonas methylaliphatogenes]CDM66065.1 predicted ATPase [Pyrinomonas methylaliphatogenes]
MQEELLGTIKGPGEKPHEYLFITTDNARARIGEFVYYLAREGSEERRILGHITARRLVRNLPDSFLSDPEISPLIVSSLIGLDEEGCEIYEITVETIGYFNERLGDFVNPRIPPNPGDPVFLASSEMLAAVLSPRKRGERGSAYIGSLLTREVGDVPIILSVKDLVSTHLAVLASTGAGKSYTAGVLIEELMMPYNRAAVLIVDPHGEYDTLRSIAQDPRFRGEDGYQPEVKIYTHDRIKVRFSTLTEADIQYLLPEGASDKMLHFLSQAYRQLVNSPQGRNRLWGYHDLRDAVLAQKYEGNERSESSNANSIDGLLWRLDSRFDKPRCIFSDTDHIPLRELFRPGQCTVLQLSDIEQQEQQVIVATLLRRVNKARMMTVRGEVTDRQSDNYLPYPVFTLLEEAHRFAPAGRAVVSTKILQEILSEGRKFGVGIGLITQRPCKLDQDVLSQCMTQIIMRIVNPFDQDTVAESVESAGRQLLAELPALSKGQAVISGVSVNTPVICRVRTRYTQHGGETFDAPAEWANYYTDSAQRAREEEEAILVKPSTNRLKIRGLDV